MSDHSRIRCPRCGAEMNRHAEKVDFSAARGRMDSLENELGGSITEIHTCPGCRFVLQTLARDGHNRRSPLS